MLEWTADLCVKMASLPDGRVKLIAMVYLLLAYNGGILNVDSYWSVQRWVRDKSRGGQLTPSAALGVLGYCVVIGLLTSFVTLGSIVVERNSDYQSDLDALSATGRTMLLNAKYAAILSYLCVGSVGVRLWQHWARHKS